MLKRKIFGIAIVAVLLLSAFMAGCGSKQQAEKPKEEPKKQEQKQEPEKKKLDFPKKEITLVVPYSAGGGTDLVARKIAAAAEKLLPVPIVIVNKPGGGSAPALIEVSRAKPDGYTLIMAATPLATLRHASNVNISYEDFESVIGLNFDPFALSVRADAPWKNIKEFIQYCKDNPGKVRLGVTAPGGAWHTAGLAFQQATGTNVKLIPFDKGAAQIIPEILGGHVDATTISAVEAGPNVRAGKLRMLAVAGDKRLDAFPDVPTFKENGIDVFPASAFRGIMAPKGTPKEIVDFLFETFREAAKDKDYIEFMKKNGYGMMTLNPKEWRDFLANQDSKFAELKKSFDAKKNKS